MANNGRTQRRSRVHTVDSVSPQTHRTSAAQGLLAFWRWLPDLIVGGTVLIGCVIAYDELTRFRGYNEQAMLPIPWWAALCVIGLPFAALAAIPYTRRACAVIWWLNITRHKLRSFMKENQIRNTSGRLPWLICIYPTKVGERAWMWLPSGISIEDINDEIDSLGPTCYAREGKAVVPFKNYSHIVRIDVHRRDLLDSNTKVSSTLLGKTEDLDLIPADSTKTSSSHTPSQWATDTGLPLTSETRTIEPSSSPRTERNATRKTNKPMTAEPTEPVVLSTSGEDISDYV